MDISVLIISEELHYFRLKLNRAPETLEEMLEIIENDSSSWILCSERKARYHMYGSDGEYNVKFVSSTQKTNNMYEAIYNLKDFNIISTTNEVIDEKESPENMGTYNYYGMESIIQEIKDEFEDINNLSSMLNSDYSVDPPDSSEEISNWEK